mmetsp:Transcript_20623/g.57415  ORF Transcript_20623/g.57415 Transcript_20623/m.57415 type:complete len:216 (+) Transcript_20623:759-1406(+)
MLHPKRNWTPVKSHCKSLSMIRPQLPFKSGSTLSGGVVFPRPQWHGSKRPKWPSDPVATAVSLPLTAVADFCRRKLRGDPRAETFTWMPTCRDAANTISKIVVVPDRGQPATQTVVFGLPGRTARSSNCNNAGRDDSRRRLPKWANPPTAGSNAFSTRPSLPCVVVAAVREITAWLTLPCSPCTIVSATSGYMKSLAAAATQDITDIDMARRRAK